MHVYYTKKGLTTIQVVSEPRIFTDNLPVDLNLHTGEFDNTTIQNDEATEAYSNLAYDFVWQTMTEQDWGFKALNYLKEAWMYTNVGHDEKMVGRLLQDILDGKAAQEFSYVHDKDIIYSYGVGMEGSDDPATMAVFSVQREGLTPKRSDLVDFIVDEDKLYTVLAFCTDQNKTKPQLLVQLANEHVAAFKKLFKSDSPKRLADGTLLGDPFPNPSIVPSGNYGKHGGTFGCTRTKRKGCKNYPGKGTQYHDGMDIRVVPNTPLHAILGGEVVWIFDKMAPGEYHSDKLMYSDSYQGGLGNDIVIKSKTKDGKYVFLRYCHLNSVDVAVGDKIKKGELIGLTGDTGNAGMRPNGRRGCEVDRLHLHLIATTKYMGSQKIDPSVFLTTKFDNNGNKK